MGRKLLADPELPNKLAPGRRGPHPSVPLPVPLHRQHLRERVARVRRQRGDRTRGRRRTPGADPSRSACSSSVRARPGSRPRACSPCRATPSRCATGPTSAAASCDAVAAADPVLARYRDWLRVRGRARRGDRRDRRRRHRRRRARRRGRRRGAGDRAGVAATRGHRCEPRPHPARAGRRPRRRRAAARDRRDHRRRQAGHHARPRAPARAARPSRCIEPTAVFGTELGLPGRWRMVADAEAAGITLLGGATVTAVTPTTVEVAPRDGHDVGARRARDLHAAGGGRTRPRRRTPRRRYPDLRRGRRRSTARGFEGITRDAEDTARALAV